MGRKILPGVTTKVPEGLHGHCSKCGEESTTTGNEEGTVARACDGARWHLNCPHCGKRKVTMLQPHSTNIWPGSMHQPTWTAST